MNNSPHSHICHALLSTPDLERRFVTSASFRAGIESIANVAELAVMALVEVSEVTDAEIALRTKAAADVPGVLSYRDGRPVF